MPLLSFLLVLAIPPLIVLVPGLGHPADPSALDPSTLGTILLVEAVLVVGYALSRLERRRLDHGPTPPTPRVARSPRRLSRNRLVAGH